MLAVEGLEDRDVALVGGAVGAETLRDGLAIGRRALHRGKGLVAEPLVKRDPAVRVLESEAVRRDRPDRPGAGPAQQPVLSVGQNAHAHPASALRLGQVIVELLDVIRIGVEAARWCRSSS